MSISDTLIDHLLTYARKAGADAADVMVGESRALSVGTRLGKQEYLENSESTDIGIRVFVGRRQAQVSSSDPKKQTLEDLTDQAVAMARAVPEDPFCGIAENPGGPADDMTAQLDLYDTTDRAVDDLLNDAIAAEDAARAMKGVTNSDGADCSAVKSHMTLATSAGFLGHVRGSSHSLSVSVIAGDGDNMQRDYDFSHKRHFRAVTNPVKIGQNAAHRTLARMNPRKVKTAHVPVVFDPRVSGGLIGSLASAASGAAIARGTSMLQDSLNEQVCAAGLTIVDDPFLPQGLRSRIFDGEGLCPQRRNLVENGILQGWILDLRAARKLECSPTGNASRAPGGNPSPRAHNLYLQPGPLPPEALIADIKSGLYVTEMMGSSVSLLTGDYSRGAAGFWIENGEIAYPVSEITIAGNLKEMWMNMTPANDLAFEYGINAPTIRLERMTVAGD